MTYQTIDVRYVHGQLLTLVNEGKVPGTILSESMLRDIRKNTDFPERSWDAMSRFRRKPGNRGSICTIMNEHKITNHG